MISLKSRSVVVLSDDEVALVSGGFNSDPFSDRCHFSIDCSANCASDGCMTECCPSSDPSGDSIEC